MLLFPGTSRGAWRRAVCLALLAVPLCAIAQPCAAQGGAVPPASAPALRPASLADALRSAAPSRDPAMVVGAESILPPAGGTAPKPGLPLSQTAANYGYVVRRFGTLLAIAPRDRVALYHVAGGADVFKNAPPPAAFALLAASLSDAQRQALLGERGMGLDDLTTPQQRSLFLTLFATQRLKVRPRPIPGAPQPAAEQERDLPIPMQTARLRVGTAVRMAVHTPGSDTPILTPIFGAGAGPRVYEALDQAHLFSSDVVDGIPVRKTEPNDPKLGDLDFRLPALRGEIRLNGLKTIGDLVSRIGSETKIELYADRRYERRSVTPVGASRAKASDLLQSLCLCLAGTFRRVGPAYVLTDDLAGVGTRRQGIVDLQADGDALRSAPLKRGEETLQSSGALWKTRPGSFGDPLAPTPAQMENEDKTNLGSGALAVLRLQFEQLTTAQKQALRHYSEDLARLHDAHPNEGYPPGVDLEKEIELNVEPSVQLLLPGVDGPIDTGLGPFVSEAFRDMSQIRRPRANAPAATADTPPSELTTGIPRRALLVNARTVQELDTNVTQMKQMGLNQLWLPVFSEGVATIAGTPFSSRDAQAVDLLAHAIKITAASGIGVYPVLDLFAWGRSVPRDTEDLTITGHTSVQDSERRLRRALLRAVASGERPSTFASRKSAVSPFAPSVPRDLSALVAAVAGRPGIAGIVWRETCPPGYDLPDTVRHLEPYGRLGYTEAARLAFLRKAHADPLDITPRLGVREAFDRADTSLPAFDDPDMDTLLERDWNAFCTQANVSVLNSLCVAAAGAAPASGSAPAAGKRPAPPLFVRERRDNFGLGWYGAWAGPNTPLPTNHIRFEDGPLGAAFKLAPSAEQQAHVQSSINLVRLPVGTTLDEKLVSQRWATVLEAIRTTKKWDGFVLELE